MTTTEQTTEQTANAFQITADSAATVAIPLTLEGLQQSVGGYIDAAFTVEGPDGHRITGYVHDEGLLIGLPLTLITDDGGHFVGPVIITGLNDVGETIALTDADMDWIEDRLIQTYVIDPRDPRQVAIYWTLNLND